MGMWNWFLTNVLGVSDESVQNASPKIQREKLLEVWRRSKRFADELRFKEKCWPKTAKVPELQLKSVKSRDRSLHLEVVMYYDDTPKEITLFEADQAGPKRAIYEFRSSYGEGDEFWYLDPYKVNQLISQLLEEVEEKSIIVSYS